MRFVALTLGLLGAMAVPAAAHADTFSFNLNGAGGGFTGAGTLTTVNNGGGVYTITGVTGSGSGSGITGLTAFNGNDNFLFPFATPILDSHGFSFIDILGADTYYVNIYSSSGSYYAFLRDEDNFTRTLPVNFTVAATPEPSSLVLLGTGMLGAAGVVARRKKSPPDPSPSNLSPSNLSPLR